MTKHAEQANEDWLDVFDNLIEDDHTGVSPKGNRCFSLSSSEGVPALPISSITIDHVAQSTRFANSYVPTTNHDKPSENSEKCETAAEIQSPSTILKVPVIPAVQNVIANNRDECSEKLENSKTIAIKVPVIPKVMNPIADRDDSPSVSSEGNSDQLDGEINTQGKALERSMRKRSREKQRRCNANAQFADLTTLLKKIESEEGNTPDGGASAISNRVDLIARTITVMEKIHNENGKRRIEVNELKEKYDRASKKVKELEDKVQVCEKANSVTKPAQQIMMMVPMMMAPNGNNATGFPMMPSQNGAAPPFPTPSSFMPQNASFGHAPGMPMMPGVNQPFFPPMFNQQFCPGVPIGKPFDPNMKKTIGMNNPSLKPQPTISNMGTPNLAHCA
mmetsp:Transcript_36109/g.44180  ORF Transcript_36109/g.44180 Transcript_36109/m.44180 type:complete len:391 (-) Transcript_36109:171-1343(-)|eukprot:CAMPEP_0172486128 /NCGR_PEP_ID=MMETSP1066-20121228/14555_1 /TAXON_ID=671091 /ORGANISM="Coscinodiscus wailesii, Strain CCMP2513" /LENGTH=390 /DNA_ID=CAMNT_0013251875 /DNA_START=108 /DNA_END=1280 /DNA_ORIENTATION=+